MELPDEVVGAGYRFDAWETVTALAGIGSRMAGSDGERAAVETMADTFRETGLSDVSVDQFEIPGWERGDSALSLSGRRYEHQHQVLALPRGPAGAVTGPVVDVGHGTPAEFEAVDLSGALALVSSGTPDDYDRWLHRREKYDLAVESGAAGFLFHNHVPGCLPPTGDVGDQDGPGAIPAAGLSREVGRRLARQAEHGTVEATLQVDCENAARASANVSGRLGPDTRDRVLVTAHHDAHDIAEGAQDNGAGCALVAGIARLLAPVADDLETAVRFVTFGAEEVGLRGSRNHVEHTALDGVRAVVNCDAIGTAPDLGIYTNGFDGLAAPFEAAADAAAVPLEVDGSVEPHSDHWPFVRQGVPGVMAYSAEESDDRGWGHTHGDTLDKLDRRDLRELSVPLADAVLRLATGDPPAEHVSPDEIARRAREDGYSLD